MSFYTAMLEVVSILRLILVWGWWAILLGWIAFLKARWKNYPIDAVIIEKRGNNLIKTNDRAGRYKDPYTGLYIYRLQKAKDTIPIPNYDHVMHNVAQHTTFFERFVNLIRGNVGTIFLFRYGSKQYKPIKVGDNAKLKYVEEKDKKGNVIVKNVYEIVDPRIQLGILNFEVIDWDNMNQMAQEWKSTMTRRQKKSEFWKGIVIPAIMIGAAVVISIVMIKLSADWTPPGQPQPQPQTNIPDLTNVNIP